MSINSEELEFQVYLRNYEIKITKKFNKVTNPQCYQYGRYGDVVVVDPEIVAKAEAFFGAMDGVKFRKTIFPDVLVVQATRETLFGELLPKWVVGVESTSFFDSITTSFAKVVRRRSIEILPRVPKLSKLLKSRFHLECMIEGIRGRSLLAPADSVWAEMPSVTIFAESPTVIFSTFFKRGQTARYQHHYVNTYLWDPLVKRVVREIRFDSSGRASPDIYLEDVDVFLHYLRKRNRERLEKGLPTLGFLNPFFYQNAHAFKRPVTTEPLFPDSVALWSANRGLGLPHYFGLKEAIKTLPGERKTLMERIILVAGWGI